METNGLWFPYETIVCLAVFSNCWLRLGYTITSDKEKLKLRKDVKILDGSLHTGQQTVKKELVYVSVNYITQGCCSSSSSLAVLGVDLPAFFWGSFSAINLFLVVGVIYTISNIT